METKDLWYRSTSGMIAGVCAGIAQKLDLEVWMIRVLLLVAVCFAGTGILAYITLAVSLPRQDKLDEALKKKVFGVCAHYAKKLGWDVGLSRAGMLTLTMFTGGTAFLFYIVLALLIDDDKVPSKS